jgi:peptidoglycan glycosyltransferase
VNTPIRRLSVLIAALFTTLLVAATVVQFTQAKTLDAMAANKRTLLDNYGRERGSRTSTASCGPTPRTSCMRS